jgi:hypothetical protein
VVDATAELRGEVIVHWKCWHVMGPGILGGEELLQSAVCGSLAFGLLPCELRRFRGRHICVCG